MGESKDNMQASKIQLMTTLGCHLCEDANAMLQLYINEGKPGQNLSSLEVELVEISEKESLIEQYGVRIPVLLKPLTGQELAWPFDMQELVEFLQS